MSFLSLGRPTSKECSVEMKTIIRLMKKALEFCRTRTVVLDTDRKQVLMRQNCSLPVIFNLDDLVEKYEIPGGVQLFLVQENNEIVAVLEAPTKLKATLLKNSNSGDCYLKVGIWIYRLIHEQTETFKYSNELYVFPFPPNIDLPTNYKAFGVVLSDDLGSVYHHNFEHLLEEHSIFKPLSPPSYSSDSDEEELLLSKTVLNCSFSDEHSYLFDDDSSGALISHTIDQGASLVCDGIEKGAEIASTYIYIGSKALKKATPPTDRPTRVPETVKKFIEMIKKFSRMSITASDMVVDGFVWMTNRVSSNIFPYLKSAATSSISPIRSPSSQANDQTIANLITIAKSATKGISKVMSGIEEASTLVARAASDATVDTINHRCGPDVADVVHQAADVVFDIGKCVSNVKQIGLKKIRIEVEQNRGKDFLESYTQKAPRSLAFHIPRWNNRSSFLPTF